MSNQKNSIYYLLDNVKQTIPANGTGTGTITTSKLGVLGTNTKFLTELQNHAWIVDLTNNELRKVVQVVSDTYAILDAPFTNELLFATALNYIPGWSNRVRESSYVIPLVKQDNTTANIWGKIDGVDFPPGLPRSLGKYSHDGGSDVSEINPVIADATGTQIAVSILY